MDNAFLLNTTGTLASESDNPMLQFDYYWQHSTRMLFFLTFFLGALMKEVLEIFNCPSTRFYWQQYENVGQWVVLLVSVIAAIHPLFGMPPYPAQIFLSLVYSVSKKKLSSFCIKFSNKYNSAIFWGVFKIK